MGFFSRLFKKKNKENIQELELMNFMLEQSKIMGISTYIKMLIAEDMKKRNKK